MAKVIKEFKDYTKEDIDKYRHQFVKNTLRRASYRWPWRNIAMNRARVGYGVYQCEKCEGLVRPIEKELDHVLPVVRPSAGFEGWDMYSLRLLCGADGFEILCRDCHGTKTRGENERRKKGRAARKRDKV